MKHPDQIRECLAMMQGADHDLVAAETESAECKTRLLAASKRLYDAREVWRVAASELRAALSPAAEEPDPLPAPVAHTVKTRPPREPIDESRTVEPKLPSFDLKKAERIRRAILRVLGERADRPVALAEVIRNIGIADASNDDVGRQMLKLYEANQVKRVRHGFWADRSWEPPVRQVLDKGVHDARLEKS